jgi:hypothetical protein
MLPEKGGIKPASAPKRFLKIFSKVGFQGRIYAPDILLPMQRTATRCAITFFND